MDGLVQYGAVMTSARERVTGFWDEHIAAWLAGDDPMPDPLPQWFDAFRGKGLGKVTRDGFPEPYVGDLKGIVATPRLVVLGLNPGEYEQDFQSRTGIFADEIRRLGSYSAWAATGPTYAHHGPRGRAATRTWKTDSPSPAAGSASPPLRTMTCWSSSLTPGTQKRSMPR